MNHFQVAWSEAARDDLLEIVDYIASHSPVNAERILDRLERRASTLEARAETPVLEKTAL